ncbi:type II/IV secretion system ATPase subunit [Candidatus Aenigmatarchaeota archaeon]
MKFKFKTGKGSIHLNLKEKKEEKKDDINIGHFATPIAGSKGGLNIPGLQSTIGGVSFGGGGETPSFEDSKELTIKGIGLPDFKSDVESELIEKEFKLTEEETTGELKTINIKYPLIPKNPKQGETVYAYTHIFWDDQLRELVYHLIEPKIDESVSEKIMDIKNYIEEKIDIDFSSVRKKEAVEYLEKIFKKSVEYFGIRKDQYDILKYFIFRDFIGLEKIEPMLNDRYIEDISCDGINIPIYVYHRDPKIGSIRTNISFDSGDEVDSFVNKLAERTGKVISVAKPLLDGTLPDGSRVQATLGSDIARQGSNFTIRMFTERPMTPTDMILFNTCNIKTMAYLWFLIEHGASILISGGTATGKTTLLNVLSLFIKPQMKIVSIEDTAELRLPHSHWIPEVARSAVSDETGKGNVDMFDLLRESLRQRPDHIIVGEVRGKEAYVLFQQMAVGHPGISTIHAESFPKLIDRLTTQPINLTASLIQNLDIIIFTKRIKKGNKYVRRINNILEVLGYDRKTKYPKVNQLFKWSPKTDSIDAVGNSVLMKKVSELLNKNDNEIKEEIIKRSKVLEWMVANNVRDYVKIGKILNMFYNSSEMLMERIEASV